MPGHYRLPLRDRRRTWARWLPLVLHVRRQRGPWLSMSLRVLSHVWYAGWDLSLWRRARTSHPGAQARSMARHPAGRHRNQPEKRP
jgi:hypothetical protein